MNWTFQPARESFESVRVDWDALNAARCDYCFEHHQVADGKGCMKEMR
jgi:hypothetical protein